LLFLQRELDGCFKNGEHFVRFGERHDERRLDLQRAAVDQAGQPGNGCALIAVDLTNEDGEVTETKQVLIFPPDTTYKEWRPIYDRLTA